MYTFVAPTCFLSDFLDSYTLSVTILVANPTTIGRGVFSGPDILYPGVISLAEISRPSFELQHSITALTVSDLEECLCEDSSPTEADAASNPNPFCKCWFRNVMNHQVIWPKLSLELVHSPPQILIFLNNYMYSLQQWLKLFFDRLANEVNHWLFNLFTYFLCEVWQQLCLNSIGQTFNNLFVK